jgi:hypothetical protein
MTGFGGQFALSQTYLNFKIPEFKPGIRTWSSFVYGFSETFQIYGSKSTIEIVGMKPMSSTSLTSDIMLAPNLGYTLGLGKFKNETKWKGVALELTYRPSLDYTTVVTENGSDHNISFNYMGFGFGLNFNNYTSNASRLAPKAQSKFTFFMLPPLKDMPLIITVGYGLTFYIKRK